MKVYLYFTLFVFLSFIQNKSIAQGHKYDTLFFVSQFGFGGWFPKKIVIKDICCSETIEITRKYGRHKKPIPLDINEITDSISITIYNRFSFKKNTVIIRINDIEEKYIVIWRNKEDKVQIDFREALFPGPF